MSAAGVSRLLSRPTAPVRRLHLIAALHGALLLSGCLDPLRLNASCEWIGDTTSTALDIAIAADRRHLANDVSVAGENATRYRDSVKVRFGLAAAGRLDAEGLDRLYATIGAQHGVRRADIDGPRRMAGTRRQRGRYCGCVSALVER